MKGERILRTVFLQTLWLGEIRIRISKRLIYAVEAILLRPRCNSRVSCESLSSP